MTNEKGELKLLGKIAMNPDGLRKLASSMGFVYGEKTIINLPVWQDNQVNLFFQLERNTGEISCVSKVQLNEKL